ncbi:685_t:CDS:2 [Entrophospora sp. SA101]|nr:685_t:CDS:2 [Entrophospora sp. SA101]
MNQNNINSLYSLVKQNSQEKEGKLKVICDWDESPKNSLTDFIEKILVSFKNQFQYFDLQLFASRIRAPNRPV